MGKPLYDITQCALYKVTSKVRLASLLHVSVPAVLGMAKSRKYREFPIKEKVCPFTGKTTKERWVQTPAEALRPLHDRILDLLKRVAPPSYAHAAVKGKSYRSNAAAHKNSAEVATFDLSSFYPSTSENAVFRFFADQLLCAPDIAGLFARLVCVEVPGSHPCLPTGSPLSPLISIYANKPMFDALERLASKSGLVFTCYIDDITFSGQAIPAGLTNIVTSLVKRYGHTLAVKKTRIFSNADAKHITGVVVHNGRVSVPNSRFRKARKIQLAIEAETDKLKKIQLMQKLNGLLGEAAYLDPKYKTLAKRSYRSLADLRNNTPTITGSQSFTDVSQLAGFKVDDSLPF
ncbi:MAG: reverse transcriptase family protein [Pseudomonadota bacterium]